MKLHKRHCSNIPLVVLFFASINYSMADEIVTPTDIPIIDTVTIEEVSAETTPVISKEKPNATIEMVTPTDNPITGKVTIEKVSAETTPVTSEEKPNTTINTEPVGSVTRAMFTSNIVDREPTDDLTSIDKDNGQLYYFTELKNLTGQTIIHSWTYKGEVMAEVKFAVGSPRWRVYSIKNILPKWTGQWTVTVTDRSGRVLQTDTIDVTSITDIAD